MNPSPEPSIMRVPLLREVISSGSLTPNFQPIVHLSDPAQILGFESLMRCRGDSIFLNPALLFDYAERKNAVVELDTACLEKGLIHGSALADPQLLFVNIRPELLSRPDLLVRTVTEAARWSDLPLSKLVLEITENSAVKNHTTAIENLSRLRELGVRFAIDDVGVAHSHLNLLRHIVPSFFKISNEFGENFEEDDSKIRIIRNIIALAHDFSAEVILEGIETAETLRRARSLGIRMGQGYLFSRPVPLAEALSLTERQLPILRGRLATAAAQF